MDFHKHIIKDTHDSSRKLVETFTFSAGRERQMGKEKPRFYDECLSCINIDLDQYGHREKWDCIRKPWRCCICPLLCLWSVPWGRTQIKPHNEGFGGVVRGGLCGVSHIQSDPTQHTQNTHSLSTSLHILEKYMIKHSCVNSRIELCTTVIMDVF